MCFISSQLISPEFVPTKLRKYSSMMDRRGLVAAVAAVVVALVAMASGDSGSCEYTTCSECISAPGCIWCSDPNITLVELEPDETLLPCISRDSAILDGFIKACGAPVHDPPTEQNLEEDNGNKPLRPQRATLKIRAGNSARLTLRYEHQINNPMDMYCLMDGSGSMTEFRESLSKVTNELVESLKNITPNVQLGFGMFVDKPALPYTNMKDYNFQTCENCVPTFSFENILPLTPNQTAFQHILLSSPDSSNTDLPEGLLDALMQVASCGDRIGWRKEAFKVAVVFTDAGFHLAGDGRLAGIVRRNDRHCHLDSKGRYTHSLWQDYPSVGELKKLLYDNKIPTTFAVSKKILPLYEMLANQLYRSSYTDMDKQSDLVKLIVEPVRDIVGTVTLLMENSVPGVDVRVFASCKDEPEQETNICKNMTTGDKAIFYLNVEIKECDPKVRQANLNFTVEGSEHNFILDLEMLCECECDVTQTEGEEVTLNATACTNQGDLRCGVCDCYKGFMGKRCHCQQGEGSSQGIDEENCYSSNTTDILCSGQGKCVCGECECNERKDPKERIWGPYCQCTNFHKDCLGTKDEICSGHGKCNCNKCECEAGWEGDVCSCNIATDDCMDAENNICSNHGRCVCNRCECEDDYEGKLCENCKFCDAKCQEHKGCVECHVFGGEGNCDDNCTNYFVTTITNIAENHGYLCSVVDSEGCRFLFQFKETGQTVSVWAQDSKECPKEINPWIIVGGTLAGVLVVGVMLLVAWKVITSIKDQREYQAFMKSQTESKWNENTSPLYVSPKTHIDNPMYGQ